MSSSSNRFYWIREDIEETLDLSSLSGRHESGTVEVIRGIEMGLVAEKRMLDGYMGFMEKEIASEGKGCWMGIWGLWRRKLRVKEKDAGWVYGVYGEGNCE